MSSSRSCRARPCSRPGRRHSLGRAGRYGRCLTTVDCSRPPAAGVPRAPRLARGNRLSRPRAWRIAAGIARLRPRVGGFAPGERSNRPRRPCRPRHLRRPGSRRRRSRSTHWRPRGLDGRKPGRGTSAQDCRCRCRSTPCRLCSGRPTRAGTPDAGEKECRRESDRFAAHGEELQQGPDQPVERAMSAKESGDRLGRNGGLPLDLRTSAAVRQPVHEDHEWGFARRR